MAVMQNILWWLAFLCLGIVLQLYVPGLDALIVGIVLVTQERDYKTMVWLVPMIILLQEGMGNQYFGASVLHVATFFALYRIALSLSLSSKMAFAFLLSLSMGGARILFDYFFATLQNIPYSMQHMVFDGLLEAAYLLVAWSLLTRLRRGLVHDEKKKES